MSTSCWLVPRVGSFLAPVMSSLRLCPCLDCVHRASGHSVGVPSRGAQPFSKWPVGRKVGTPTGKRADRSSADHQVKELGERMRHMLTRVTSDQRGMTTVEYAMGTAAIVGLGGVLIKFFSSDTFRDVIWAIIRNSLSGFIG